MCLIRLIVESLPLAFPLRTSTTVSKLSSKIINPESQLPGERQRERPSLSPQVSGENSSPRPKFLGKPLTQLPSSFLVKSPHPVWPEPGLLAPLQLILYYSSLGGCQWMVLKLLLQFSITILFFFLLVLPQKAVNITENDFLSVKKSTELFIKNNLIPPLPKHSYCGSPNALAMVLLETTKAISDSEVPLHPLLSSHN